MENQKIIVRYPPSPTGLFHIGNARTFLFNYLFAKQNDGQIVFRLEDTDKERSKEEYANDIIENLKWLGIEPDFSTMVKQSERSEIYKKYINKLIEEGKAYFAEPAFAEATAGEGRKVIRFRNPNKKIKFNDLIRGDIEFDTTELKDFVIAKSLDEPVYHLAVVVDDFEMGVTHIIRGDDGISNTPRQILIQEAIGAPRPIYAHLPLMLAEDKTKLSKRKHGEQVSVSFYKNAGYLPEAMINFLVMVGWNPGNDQEIWSKEELIKIFDIKKVQKKGGIFNIEKLRWLNKEYMRLQKNNTKNLIIEKLKVKFENKKIHPKLVETIFEKIEVISDIDVLIENGELDYFFNKPELEIDKICWKNQSKEDCKQKLEKILVLAKGGTFEDFLRCHLRELAEKEGKGEVLWPLRYVLSGREKSPDPFTLIEILGVEETIKRIQNAIQIL
ncbi:MAG: glutamate--tRNA ligase family protein [Patescibacteria group bacterium]